MAGQKRIYEFNIEKGYWVVWSNRLSQNHEQLHADGKHDSRIRRFLSLNPIFAKEELEILIL